MADRLVNIMIFDWELEKKLVDALEPLRRGQHVVDNNSSLDSAIFFYAVPLSKIREVIFKSDADYHIIDTKTKALVVLKEGSEYALAA